MMKTKVIILITYSLFLITSLSSCSDFWDPESDDMINGNDYIANNTEMYTGFLGIMTKMQEVGDKEILLTETRGELVEPTANSLPELISLYNYDSNLQGNSYADPAGWYEVIIACNDYLAKMKEYKNNPDLDEEKYKDLVASTVRVKIWAYKTLGEIYGKAYWFDDPITKVEAIKNEVNFKLMDMEQISDQCLALCNGGYEGIELNRDLDWAKWLDPDQALAESAYRKWNTMVPAYAGLYAELNLWKGAYLDSKSQDATSYYKAAADILLDGLTKIWSNQVGSAGTSSSFPYCMPNAHVPGSYRTVWENAQPYPLECISAIIYDYTKNQTNSLLKHFSKEYPNQYLLAPSAAGEARFLDGKFNPGGEGGGTRYNTCFGNASGGGRYIAKFRREGSSVRSNAYQDDVHVYTYRGTQYHTLLIEALNHLKRFTAMDAVMNKGVLSSVLTDDVKDLPEWEGFNDYWTGRVWSKYPNNGLRGCYTLTARDMKVEVLSADVPAAMRHNDLQVLDETILEFACEGKVYPTMNRMAVRYNDPSIVADRVCPKYEATGRAEAIRAKIMDGGYWVNYQIQ